MCQCLDVSSRSGKSRSFQALVAPLPMPSFIPAYHYVINDYMVFDTNYASLMGVVYLAYYYLLEPVAAVSLGHFLSWMSKLLLNALIIHAASLYASNGRYCVDRHRIFLQAGICYSSGPPSCIFLDRSVHWARCGGRARPCVA